MAVATDRQFMEYCAIIGVPQLAEDERFRLNRGRVMNRADLIPLLVEPMRVRTTAEWIAAFESAAIPCGPINSIDQVFADPQVKARGMQIELARDDGTKVPGVANPIRFSQTPVAYAKAPPAFGEGPDRVLTEVLGLTAEEINRLRVAGAIG